MKSGIFAIILSMTAAFLLVNASAEDLPIGNQPQRKASKESAKRHARGLKELVELLLKTGDDSPLPESLSEQIGLSGTPPTKGRDFTVPRPKGAERRECTIVLSGDAQDATPASERRPTCLYIQHKIVSGHDAESHYYRMNLEGKLEKASVLEYKLGDDGKPVAGSGVSVDKDITSPEIQKSFQAEYAYWTKDWVKAEKKAEAHKTGNSSDSPPK